MEISNRKVVSIHYTLTNTDGDVLDTSRNGEPLAYLHGAGNIIPGLENALAGKRAGDRLNVSVAPDEGYGTHDPAMVQRVPRAAFQGIDTIEPGMQFHAETAEGLQTVTVVEVDDETVVVDGNHPMAGQILNFDVEIAAVREASAEELDHGHVHGAGGHHH
ncbi:MAG: peptidylprolyl isomerase [Methylococcaceae bacterium]|nr:peptidylprolyl isomerase [Methylococcaceae bacterium]